MKKLLTTLLALVSLAVPTWAYLNRPGATVVREVPQFPVDGKKTIVWHIYKAREICLKEQRAPSFHLFFAPGTVVIRARLICSKEKLRHPVVQDLDNPNTMLSTGWPAVAFAVRGPLYKTWQTDDVSEIAFMAHFICRTMIQRDYLAKYKPDWMELEKNLRPEITYPFLVFTVNNADRKEMDVTRSFLCSNHPWVFPEKPFPVNTKSEVSVSTDRGD